MWNKIYYYFHSHSSGFNSTLNVLLHFLLCSHSRPVGFTKIQSSIDSPFSHWQGRNSWSSISPGTYLSWIPINYPCSDFTESALSLYCWNRTWFAHEWKMLFNVWYPPYPDSAVESQWVCFDLDAITTLAWIFLKMVFARLFFPGSLFHYSVTVIFSNPPEDVEHLWHQVFCPKNKDIGIFLHLNESCRLHQFFHDWASLLDTFISYAFVVLFPSLLPPSLAHLRHGYL